jgi:hypothetical protein
MAKRVASQMYALAWILLCWSSAKEMGPYTDLSDPTQMGLLAYAFQVAPKNGKSGAMLNYFVYRAAFN